MGQEQTFLHVDDDPAILRIVAHKLGQYGYDAVSVEDPRQALKRLLESGARIVILDIDMPHIDGLSLLRQLKEHDGGIQVIMLTGMVSMGTVMQAMRWGAEGCVFKPIDDFDPLLNMMDAAYQKIDRWWDALYERSQRKQVDEPAMTAAVKG
ncbi:MAG: response regulator [Pirellulaceae bacterium]|nr:response regulator [Planctomycetales bacterium]